MVDAVEISLDVILPKESETLDRSKFKFNLEKGLRGFSQNIEKIDIQIAISKDSDQINKRAHHVVYSPESEQISAEREQAIINQMVLTAWGHILLERRNENRIVVGPKATKKKDGRWYWKEECMYCGAPIEFSNVVPPGPDRSSNDLCDECLEAGMDKEEYYDRPRQNYNSVCPAFSQRGEFDGAW